MHTSLVRRGQHGPCWVEPSQGHGLTSVSLRGDELPFGELRSKVTSESWKTGLHSQAPGKIAVWSRHWTCSRRAGRGSGLLCMPRS